MGVLAFGDVVAERGTSRLGLDDEVGVVTFCDEFIRRGRGAEPSRGEAMVDMVLRGRAPSVAFQREAISWRRDR